MKYPAKRFQIFFTPLLALLTLGAGLLFSPDFLEAQSKVRGFVTVYPRSKSFSTGSNIHMSVFTRGGQKVVIYLTPLSRQDFQKYSLDPWSRSYKEVTAGIKLDKNKARLRKTYNVQDGANYFALKHNLKAGYYLLAAELQGASPVRAYSTVLISDLGLISKQSESGLLLYTAHLKTGTPLGGASIEVFGAGKSYKLKTDSRGRVLLPLSGKKLNLDRINIVARHKGQQAQLFSGKTPYEDSRYQVFIDTERPIYKTGHTVNWFAVVRTKKKGTLTNVPRRAVSFKVLSAQGKNLGGGKARLDYFGKVAGKFKIPGGTGGFFTVMVSVDGENHQANFLVKDYVKPSLSVQVAPDERAVVYGKPITGKIKAKFLHGAIPSGGDVEYKVYKGYYKKPGFSISSEERFFDLFPNHGRGGGAGELITTGKGTLDKSGQMDFRIPTSAEHKNSVFSIRVTVIVRDHRGNPVDRGAGGAGVKVLEGDLILSARQSSFIIAPGQTETLKVRVLDLKNKPAVGKEIELSIFSEHWDRTEFTKNNQIGATATYKKIQTLKGKTNNQGIALIPFRAPGEGHYRVVARTRDGGGNQLVQEVYYWVANRGFESAGGVFPELDIKSDKRFYRPGDTARILITSSVKNAKVLLTLEGDRIFEHHVVTLKGNTYLMEVPLKNKAYLPNVYFTALLVKDGRLINGALPVFISPRERFIRTKLTTAKETYKPGEKVKLKVLTTDAGGRPVQGSVAVGVVDEAIFLVQSKLSPSIEKFYYGRRPNRTRLTYSFPAIFTGGAAKDQTFPDSASRSKFKDTAFFKANVETNRRGVGTVEFTLPGNLTTWRITGVAVDKGNRVGTQVNKFLSTKELLARLSVPRYLNTGSKGEAVAIVRNIGKKDLKIIAQFKGKGLNISRKGLIRATVKAGEKMTFETNLSSNQENRKAALQFFVKTEDNSLSDSLERPVPVFETGLNHKLASPGIIFHGRSGEQSGETAIVDPVLKNKVRPVKYEVVVYPNLVGTVLGSVEYLLDYPHGCVEQTTSRFLPNIEVLRFLRKHKIRNKKLEKKLNHNINGGIRNLLGLQNQQRGGWGWWRSQGSYAVNHWMTAYALYGLVTARNNGFAVNQKQLDLGLAALRKMVMATGNGRSRSLDTKDYPQKESFVYFANYILTLAGKGDPSLDDAAVVLRNKSNLESLGWAARSLKLTGRNKEYALVRGEILERARDFKFSENTTGPNTSRQYYSAIAMGGIFADPAASADPEREQKMAEFVKNLLANRSHDGKIISTRETAASVITLLQFLDGNRKYLKPNLRLTLDLPDGKTRTLKIDRRTPVDRPIIIPLANSSFDPAKARLKVRYQGLGLGQVYLRARVFEPTREFKAINKGIEVKRAYVSEGGSPGRNAFTGSLANGEAIDVVIDVKLDGGGNYMMVSEEIPPGFVVESNFDSSYGRRNVVVTKNRVYFYIQSFWGKERIRYRLRAVNRGSYLVAPTRAELMYRDTIQGASTAEVLKVE